MNKQLNPIVYSLFFIIAIAPFAAFFSVRFLGIGFYNLVNFLLVIVLGLTLVTKAQTGIKFPKYAVFLFLFLVYTVLSDVIIVGKSISPQYLVTNRLLGSLMVILIIENTYFSFKFIKRLYRILKIILVLAVIFILVQQVIDINFFMNDFYKENKLFDISDYTTRLPSIYSWSSAMDIGLGFMPFLAIVLSVELKKKSKFFWIWLVMGFTYSILTKARWIMLGFVTISLMIFIYKKINVKAFFQYALIAIVVGLVSFQGLKLIGVNVNDIITYRILESDKSNINKMSAGTRIFAFKVFQELFPENPVFGKGMFHSFGGTSEDRDLKSGLKGRSSQIHVGYLSLLYYYGLIGGVFYLLFLYFLLKYLHKRAKLSGNWGAFFGFLTFLIANLTLVYLPILTTGIIICLVFNKYFSQQIPIPQRRNLPLS